jgi:hypothetical protein
MRRMRCVILLTVAAVWAVGSVPVAFGIGWVARRFPPVTAEWATRPEATVLAFEDTPLHTQRPPSQQRLRQ